MSSTSLTKGNCSPRPSTTCWPRTSACPSLGVQVALARWYALARTERAAIELCDEVAFFNEVVGAVRKITGSSDQASKEVEQEARQFFSDGLAAGEVVDILALADKDRPELSVLSGRVPRLVATRSECPKIQVRLLEKLLRDDVRAQVRRNLTQASSSARRSPSSSTATSSGS